MKTAIYTEDGVTQIVLTPQTAFEQNVINMFNVGEGVSAHVEIGSFYDCRGGWVRQSAFHSGHPGSSDDKSLIVVVNTKGTD